MQQKINKTVQTYPPSPMDDEIDLYELALVLWKKKLLIVLFMVLSLGAAVAYLMMTTERWTSVAYVSAPRVEQIKAYLEQRRGLARVDGNQVVDTGALVSSLFANFIRLSATEQIKYEFLAADPYYQNLISRLDPIAARNTLLSLSQDDLKTIAPAKDMISPSYTISFSATTAQEAHRVLTDYIAEVNKQTFQLVDKEFVDHLSASILARRAELENISFKLRSDRDNQIVALLAALRTAKAAGLKDYTGSRSDGGNTIIELRDANRLFMLGEKYLLAELSTAQESPLVFPPRYFEIQRDLSLLEPMLEYQVASSYSYSFQLPPTLPTVRDAPKKMLVIALSLVLGGMLGTMWVLLGSALGKRNKLEGQTGGHNRHTLAA